MGNCLSLSGVFLGVAIVVLNFEIGKTECAKLARIPFVCMSVPKVTITFYFPTGFIAGIKGSSSNTAVEVKRFSLLTLRESSAVGAAALGAKCVHYSLPIDFDSMVDEFFRYEFQ